MNPTVAVVIPTLNEERFIADVIESVINQSYDFTLVDLMVIDGGSRDKTQEIVKSFASKYDNIRLINNPKRIQSAAFNIGVKASTAPYIIRLDAHANYDKDYISLCVRCLEEIPNVGNVGGCLLVESFNKTLQARANAVANKVRFGIGGASFRVGAKAGDVDTVPFGAFPRGVIEKIGGMREDLPRGEDNEFNSRIRKNGYRIYFDPAIICTYYARPTVSKSCKQMFANGLSIGNLLRTTPEAVGIRHLVPFAFVSSLMLSLVLSVFIPHMTWVFIGVLSLYLIADIIASLSASRQYGWKFMTILPILFFSIHLSYGWGTIVGLFKNQ